MASLVILLDTTANPSERARPWVVPRISAPLSQMGRPNRLGLQAHSDRELQGPLAAGLAQVVPKTRHLRRINGRGMLKVLFSTEVLPIQILHPLSDDFFI